MTVQLSPKRKDLGRSLEARFFGLLADECAIPGGILEDDREWEGHLPCGGDLLPYSECGRPLVITLSTGKDALRRLLKPRENPFDIGDEPLTGSPGLDRKTEFRNLDSPCHTPHHSNGKITGLLDPYCPLDWLALLRNDGVGVPVTAGVAGDRDEQEVREVGDLEAMVDNLDLAPARRTGPLVGLPHLLSTTDLLARDLDGHGRDDDVLLLTKSDDVTVYVSRYIAKVF